MLAILQKHGFEVNQELHTGKNSKLFSVVGKDSEDYVVKVVKDPSGSKSIFMFTQREILEKLKGQELIINLTQVFEDANMEFYCFPFCKYTDLETFLTGGRATHVREPTLQQLCKQLCGAIRIIHENGIIHGEIHPENILVYNKYKNDDKILLFDIKLAGFSRSIFVDRVPEIPSVKKVVGVPLYYSPERIHETYGQAGDVWAAGILMFCIAYGYMPFIGNDINELAQNIINTKFDPRKETNAEGPWFSSKHHPIDVFGKQLVGNMLQHDVKDRYTAKECLEHSWLNDEKRPWDQLLRHLKLIKSEKKNLRFRYYLGMILSIYLPKRIVDMVKDFQHIYLDKKTDNGFITDAVELHQFIQKIGGKVSTKNNKKLFDTLNTHNSGVSSNGILSALAIDYVRENTDILKTFCDELVLDGKLNASNLITFAKKNSIKCDKVEITKEFTEVFSAKTVSMNQFTVELFGVDAINFRYGTHSQDPSSIGMEFDSEDLDLPSYNIISTKDLSVDNHIMCDDTINDILEKQEQKGKRTVFEEMETSDESDESSNSICQKLCACFY